VSHKPVNAKGHILQFARRQKRLLRFRLINPGRFALEVILGRIADLAASRHTVRVLILSDARETTSEEQLNPFSAYRSELKDELQVISLHLLVGDVLRAPAVFYRMFDVILLKLSFRTQRDKVLQIVQSIRRGAGAKPLLYFDGDDDICVQWPEILPYVELYVKKHMFRDKAQYLLRYEGKSNLTDYVHKQYGLSFADNVHAQETSPVAAGQLDKLALGGNVALDSNIMDLYARRRAEWGRHTKDVDVMFRGNVPNDWLHYLRKDIAPSLTRLQESYRVIAPQQRVSREEYYREMERSKICLSPFGFGEICWRDFEAVICGCLLVKPDMSHIQTLPNLFRPYETYVPVRWDYSDVYERCSHYLQHPEERERIVAAAFKALQEFYDGRGFVKLFSGILKRASLSKKEGTVSAPEL
jgi:hypothetical protein